MMMGGIFCGIAFFEYIFYAATLPESKRMRNLMKLYTVGLENYNTLTLMN
jgi:hypothetical protein